MDNGVDQFTCEDCGDKVYRYASSMSSLPNVCCICQYLRESVTLTDGEKEELRRHFFRHKERR